MKIQEYRKNLALSWGCKEADLHTDSSSAPFPPQPAASQQQHSIKYRKSFQSVIVSRHFRELGMNTNQEGCICVCLNISELYLWGERKAGVWGSVTIEIYMCSLLSTLKYMHLSINLLTSRELLLS